MAAPHSYLPALGEQPEGLLTEAGLLAVGGVSFLQKLGQEDQGQWSEKCNGLNENTWQGKPRLARTKDGHGEPTQTPSSRPGFPGTKSTKAGRGPCRAGGRLTHKHGACGEVFRLHVRVPVEPQLLGLDPPVEGREQLGHPEKEKGED